MKKIASHYCKNVIKDARSFKLAWDNCLAGLSQPYQVTYPVQTYIEPLYDPTTSYLYGN